MYNKKEDFDKLPPAPEGYHWVWIYSTYDPPRPEFQDGWKLACNKTFIIQREKE